MEFLIKETYVTIFGVLGMSAADKIDILLKSYLMQRGIKAVIFLEKSQDEGNGSEDPLIVNYHLDPDLDEESNSVLVNIFNQLLDRDIITQFLQRLDGEHGIFELEGETLLITEPDPGHALITIISNEEVLDRILPSALILLNGIRSIQAGNLDIPLERDGALQAMKFSFKVVVLGDDAVEKTSLLTRFVEKSFDQEYKSTIGTNVMRIDYELLNKVTVAFALWDLAGQGYFQRVRQMYLSGCHAAVFLYDVTQPETLSHLREWKDELQAVAGSNMRCLMVGITQKGVRRVTYEEGRQMADELGMPYLEASILRGNALNRAFGSLAFLLVQNKIFRVSAPDDWRNMVVNDFREQLRSRSEVRGSSVQEVETIELQPIDAIPIQDESDEPLPTDLTSQIRALPTFTVKETPRSKKWHLRYNEELDMLEWFYFNIFKQVRKDPKSTRVFHCDCEIPEGKAIRRITFEIRLPLNYPYEMPIPEGYGFKAFIRPAGESIQPCLGELADRWDKTGAMGVAHYLLMLSYYTASALFAVKLPDD